MLIVSLRGLLVTLGMNVPYCLLAGELADDGNVTRIYNEVLAWSSGDTEGRNE